MKRLLACWFDRMRAWGRWLFQCQERGGGALWLRLAPGPAPADALPAWAVPVRELARQTRRDGVAAVTRLAGRLPAGVSALGEWRGDNRDPLRLLAARHGWPAVGEQAGRREIHHWLWLARGRESAFTERDAARLPDDPAD